MMREKVNYKKTMCKIIRFLVFTAIIFNLLY